MRLVVVLGTFLSVNLRLLVSGGLCVQDKKHPDEEKTTRTSAQLAPPRSGIPAPKFDKWHTTILRESGNPDVNLAPLIGKTLDESFETPTNNSIEVHNIKHVARSLDPSLFPQDDPDDQTVNITESQTNHSTAASEPSVESSATEVTPTEVHNMKHVPAV